MIVSDMRNFAMMAVWHRTVATLNIDQNMDEWQPGKKFNEKYLLKTINVDRFDQ